MSTTVNFKTAAIAVAVSVACSATLCWMMKGNTKEIVVVDAVKLFNGFKMKIEMEETAAVKLKQMNHKSDSLGNIIKVLQSNQKPIDDGLVSEYRNALAALEAEYQQSNRDINEQVWKRINPILAEFGKERNSGVVIGANGMGTVLYNDPSYDKTEEAIIYLNRSYENKK
ncbi:MAG: OmpH family outer membrane protein [Chitinophagaceae bacterium]|nr:OmpH family outer membrane protein [Chitinophagaceae bacterium]